MTAEASPLGRVLIADDEIQLLSLLSEVLSTKGYEASCHPSGREALEALQGREFDIVMADLKMPDMDGIALLRAAFQLDPHLVGIVITGHGTTQTAVEAMRLGAFDYLLKPVEIAELLRTVARAMSVRQLRMENVELRATAAIADLCLAAAFTRDVEVILAKVADAAVEGCKPDELSIMVPIREGDELRVAVVRGEERQQAPERILGCRVPRGAGIAGWVARFKEPLMLQGEVRDPRFAPIRPRSEIRASVSMPMLTGGKLVGVLNVNAIRRSPFTLGEVRALTILAGIAASAVDNAQLFDALHSQARQLEVRVDERTRELQDTNAKLREFVQEVEAASRQKTEFLANMSHELRTPLNSIIGFAEILQGEAFGSLTEKQARYLTHIWNSGKHLLQLISDLLDLSKVEAGKFVLQPETLPVQAALEDILVIARGLAHKKAQEIQTDIDPALPALRADPVRFKQILFNLLSNAVKFTPEQGRIGLVARRVSAAEDCLEIRVTDTGVGIKAEDLPRLFKEFVQLQTTQEQRHEGTGLGLALTRRLVELHGGRIRADSDGEGKGSTFTILLPFGGPPAAHRSSPGGDLSQG